MTEDNTQTLNLQSVLDISKAGELRIQLMDFLESGTQIVLNGEEVERVDAAVLQLLCAFATATVTAGGSFQWSEVSPSLLEAARLTGLTDLLLMQNMTV